MLKFFCSLISLFLFLSCSHKKVETISLSKKEKIELNKFLMQEDQAGLNIVDDPFIRNLSKKLLAQNLSLKASSQKLLSLKKVMGISDSAFYPQLTASLSTTRSKSPSQFQKDPQNQATFSMAASYELDIWGRTKALSQSAYFDYGAAKLEYHAQKISLLAELHEQYFLFIKNQMHLRQIDKSLELAKEQKNILSLSFEEGLSQSIELLREDEFAAKLKAQKTLIISQKKTICYNIAVLLGDFNLLKNSNLKELEAKKLPPLLILRT